MGAQSSSVRTCRGMPGPDLCVPLLPSYNKRQDTPLKTHVKATEEAMSAVPSVSSSVPASFKASRRRKTKDFIGSEKELEENEKKNANAGPLQRDGWEFPSDIDPQVFMEADAYTLTRKVAACIHSHIVDGDKFYGGAAQVPKKKDDDFHEAHYMTRGVLRPCNCFLFLFGLKKKKKPETAPFEVVYRLIDDIATSLYFCKQVVVLCAIYIDRLLEQTGMKMTSSNWRTIVIASLMVASKVWEDINPWNADVHNCLWDISTILVRPGGLYTMESLLLKKLQWKVFVKPEVYVAYFFALFTEEGEDEGGSSNAEKIVSRSSFRHRMGDRRHLSENFETIMEEEVYLVNHCESDSSLSRLVPKDSVSSFSSPPTPKLFNGKQLWSREDMVASFKRDTLSGAESAACLRAKRDAWQLDKTNPLIGSLRHAPRALAPSRHLPKSRELLWDNEVAMASAADFGPPLLRNCQGLSINTISGATGKDYAREIRKFVRPGSKEPGTDAEDYEKELSPTKMKLKGATPAPGPLSAAFFLQPPPDEE